MAKTGLRPILTVADHATALVSGEIFERAGAVVRPDRKLGQFAGQRPPGVTTHQWNCALRTHFDYVVCDGREFLPTAAITFAARSMQLAEWNTASACPADQDEQRTIRMTHTVCASLGLPVLRIESASLPQRRVIEYLLDARAYLAATADLDASASDEDGLAGRPTGFRDIIGRLPDGRSGFVNDISAVARAAAVEVYVRGQLNDPIIRGLHVRWHSGIAEGWAWAEVREGLFIFERTRLWPHGFSCGIDEGQLAEDLAAMAIGERLKALDEKALDESEPDLIKREQLADAIARLRGRADELAELPASLDLVALAQAASA